MPRDAAGTYTLPTGNPVVGGTTIDVSWANNTLNDIAAALTGSLATTKGYSSTYTPTLTAVANVAASTSRVCQYTRVGDVVSVSGVIDIDPTVAGGALTQLGISLPVASNLASISDCGGSGMDISNLVNNGGILADTVNDRAQLNFAANSLANGSISIHFMYRVI